MCRQIACQTRRFKASETCQVPNRLRWKRTGDFLKTLSCGTALETETILIMYVVDVRHEYHAYFQSLQCTPFIPNRLSSTLLVFNCREISLTSWQSQSQSWSVSRAVRGQARREWVFAWYSMPGPPHNLDMEAFSVFFSLILLWIYSVDTWKLFFRAWPKTR